MNKTTTNKGASMKTTADQIKIGDKVRNDTCLFTIESINQSETRTGKTVIECTGPFTRTGYKNIFTGRFDKYATSKVTILNR